MDSAFLDTEPVSINANAVTIFVIQPGRIKLVCGEYMVKFL